MGRRPTIIASIYRISTWAAALALALFACTDRPNQPDPPDPPLLSCPSPVSLTGVVGSGQTVTYAMPTVVGGAPPVAVICNPPSGSTFPVGATTATCTAQDSMNRQTACSFAVSLTSASLDARTYLAFGDSVTAGEDGRTLFIRPMFIDPVRAYPAVLQGRLNTAFPADGATVDNKGKGGEYAAEGVTRLIAELDAAHPDALLLLEGYNDLLNFGVAAADAVVAALRTDVRNARGRGVRFVIVSTLTPPRKATGPRDRAIDIRAIQETNARLIPMVASENALLVNAYDAFIGREAELVGDDGLHLTPAGNQVLAELFYERIRASLSHLR